MVEELTKEDLDQINKDIQDVKQSLVSKETQDAAEKAKKETEERIKQELELKNKLAEQEKANAEMKKKIEETEKLAADKLMTLQKKVDDLASSKAVLNREDPFRQVSNSNNEVARWDDAKVAAVEEESARAFFGSDYDSDV